MTRNLRISPYVIDQIKKLSEKAYPEEACGFVVGPVGKPLAVGVFPVRNIQYELHAKDPKTYSRDAKTAYNMDPQQVKVVERECRLKHFEIKMIYHSHPEHGVYFSEEDKMFAAPWGEPNYPEMGYVVVSVMAGHAEKLLNFIGTKKKQIM